MSTEEIPVIQAGRAGRPPGFKGSSNRTIEYKCHRCGNDVGKDALRARRVSFLFLGKPTRLVRTRTVEWVCVPCMEKDADYNREPLTEAPGNRDIYHATTA